MLTNRQYQILNELENATEEYFKGARLIATVGCSLKTLQNEIKVLKSQLQTCNCSLLSIPSKGYSLQIESEEEYKIWKSKIWEEKEREVDLNNPMMRVSYILTKLLAHNQYFKLEDIAEEMFISRASISSDIRSAREILAKYGLRMLQKPNYGVCVEGLEKDKRLCIVKERLPLNTIRGFHAQQDKHKQMIKTISDVVSEKLMKSQYKTSDVVFQNLILHIYVAINRMLENEYLEQGHVETPVHCAHEKIIAESIFRQLQEYYYFEILPEEVDYLALNLLGKRSYEKDEIINSQTDSMVNDILELIKEKIDIDFSGDIELRISLALHLVPLLSRVKYNMQLKNSMVKEIKQHFTLAFDMATIASSYIEKHFKIRLDEDEIAYLAVHFNLSLQNCTVKQNPKRVLVICNARRGDSLMLQHTILKHFQEMISKLDIVNAIDVPHCDITSYDCILATFLNHENIPKQAVRINFFLDESDLNRIGRMLRGEHETEELLKFFDENLFLFIPDFLDKDEVLKRMCDTASSMHEFDEPLYQAVIARERLGFTAFGNQIAVPHPESLIAHKTFVSTAITKYPIDWGEQKVQLIFLVCVEKGNQKDLRSLFECISALIMDPDSIEIILHHHDYDTLIRKLGSVIP